MELSEAKKVMASRADLIASAKREAEAIRRQAEEKAKQVLSEETILLQAKQRANEGPQPGAEALGQRVL